MNEKDDRPTVAPVEGKWARLRNGTPVGPISFIGEGAPYPYWFGHISWTPSGQQYKSVTTGIDIIEVLDAPEAPAAPAAKDDGGPAFPSEPRDVIAMAALPTVANAVLSEDLPPTQGTARSEAIGSLCYWIADAMLAARKA